MIFFSFFRHVDEMFSKFEAPNLQVTLNWIREQVLKRRKLDKDLNDVGDEMNYCLEAMNDPGIPLQLDTLLSDVEAREFKLVRDEGKNHKNRSESNEISTDKASLRSGLSDVLDTVVPDMFTIKATLYASYTVHAIYKFGRAEVSLGVSGQKIDVNPLPRTASRVWSFVPKPVSFAVDDVADFVEKRRRKCKSSILTCYKY